MTSLLDKLWAHHRIGTPGNDGEELLFIDRHYLHEGSFHAFAQLTRDRRPVVRPELSFAFADHYVPSRTGAPPATAEIDGIIQRLTENCESHGITLVGREHLDQGIVHVAAPELGLTLPGCTVVCGDSHTSTHGAFGAYAFGIGASEAAHVLATQTLWRVKPSSLRVAFQGALPRGVHAKDLILALIARIGADGASGRVLEYTGQAVRMLSMAGRMTLCNMSIEAGARAGIIAPDDTTFEYLAGRPYAPMGPDWETALSHWRRLSGDDSGDDSARVEIHLADLAPMVTWGTSPETALPVTARVPEASPGNDGALKYMDLAPGTPLTEIPIHRVFIGSCTNGRLEDLREAARVLQGRRSRVPGFVVPGSQGVRRAAEAEGLDRIFEAAGLEWRAGSGCSLCVGLNGDLVAPGQRCASSTNRNFPGRQGPGARTHLMSPAMVAAAAIRGKITDVRELLEEHP